MRKNIVYLILHAGLWAVLFWLLPVMLPSVPGTILDGGVLSLVMIWYPCSCLAAGFFAGLTPRIRTSVRAACLALLAAIGTPGLIVTGVGHPAGIALPLLAYGSGVLLALIVAESRAEKKNREKKENP